MAPARLSALDASFLQVETPTAHMHVGWAAIFEPPEDRPRPSFEELRAHVASRLAFLAMAQARSGHPHEARRTLDELRVRVEGTDAAIGREARALAAEAERLTDDRNGSQL